MVQKVLLLYCTLAAVAYVSAVPVRNSYHPTKNIVELAAGIPELSTLVTALKAGKLTTALSGDGPFTVFAPTNEAFSAFSLLFPDYLDYLLKPANIKELDALLEYHVIPGAAIRAEDLKASQDVKTLEGQKLHITKVNGSVTVQTAKVTEADVAATNGVVHVINRLLAPPGAGPSNNGTAHACHAVLEGPTTPFGAGPLCIMRFVVDCEDITTRDMHYKPLDCRASGWPVCCEVQGHPTFGNFSYDNFPRWYKAGTKCSDITRTSAGTVPFTPCSNPNTA